MQGPRLDWKGWGVPPFLLGLCSVPSPPSDWIRSWKRGLEGTDSSFAELVPWAALNWGE